jgi:hypothetical protein
MIGALWDYGRFDQSKWDTLVVSGAISEAPDTPAGLIVRVIEVSGESSDGPDLVAGFVGVRGAVYAAITENPDACYGRVQVKYAYRGGWAPQYNYKREWEKEAAPEIIEEAVALAEVEPEFIPTAPPMDPAVARMIAAMMRGPEMVDSEEDDISAILMEM